jgi:choline dehydrogenase
VQDEGFGKSHTTTHRAERSGTFRAFAERYVGGNLTVLPNSQVTRVLVEQGRAVGVEVSRFGERVRLLAEREVVLSAGAVGTPHILLLSGIGDTQHLKEVSTGDPPRQTCVPGWSGASASPAWGW